jgi:hypothetical protein
MKRTPLLRRTPLAKGPGPKRRAKLESKRWSTPEADERRRARKTKRRDAQFAESSGYRKWVLEQPCAACGTYDPEAGSQPAHVGKTRGAGAKADRVLSLCWECHLWEGARRNEFNAAFSARHGVTTEEMARYRFEMFHRDREV